MGSFDNVYLRARSMFHGEGLKARTLRGSTWSFFGYGAQQVLRLGSNMIMTRLLFPEAFGLMSLAFAFVAGLQMFSDMGIRSSIVQSKRGDDIDFLNTAWTIQIIRGIFLWVVSCLLAYPAAQLYKEQLILPVLCLVGSTAAIQGFQTTGHAASNRKLQLGKLTLVDLVAQVTGLVTMVVWAYISPTIWSLVGGSLVSSIFTVVLAHKTLNTHRHKFQLEAGSTKEIIGFGKWIFLASALSYIGGEGLRLIQGVLVPMTAIGMIAIAANIAQAFKNLTIRITSSVLFPVFSETFRASPEDLKKQLLKSRKYLFLLTFPPYMLLIVLGQPIIALLYDQRYQDAGLYLSIMSVGAALSAVRDPFGMALLAVGDSASHTINMSALAFLRVSGMFVGFHMGGVAGMLIADVIAEMCVYPVEAWRLRKHGLWFPALDLASFGIYSALGAAVYWFSYA